MKKLIFTIAIATTLLSWGNEPATKKPNRGSKPDPTICTTGCPPKTRYHWRNGKWYIENLVTGQGWVEIREANQAIVPCPPVKDIN